MVFAPGAGPVPVRWYFADPAQPWLPDGNRFVSDNWISRESNSGDLGEQPGSRPWVNGSDQKKYPVQTDDPCVLDGKFLNGLESMETTGPWDSDGKLACCTPHCCPDLPLSLTATFPVGQGCPCLDLVELELIYDPPSNEWRGTATVCSSELLEVIFRCDGVGCDLARLSVSFENHGQAPTVAPNGGCTCSPGSWDFTGIEFPDQGTECDGPCRVLVG